MTLQEINKLGSLTGQLLCVPSEKRLNYWVKRTASDQAKKECQNMDLRSLFTKIEAKPEHALSDDMKKQIVELKQSKYQEANFCHFQELLENMLY